MTSQSKTKVENYNALSDQKPRFSGNSLPSNKILDSSEIKVFADDNLNVAQMLKVVFDGLVNIVRQGENLDYKHFLLSHYDFKSPLY